LTVGFKNVDAKELADEYATVLSTLGCDIEIRLGTDGALSSLRFEADMSGVFDAMLSDQSPLVAEASETEREELREAFADTTFTIESLTSFTIDDSIVVTPPKGDFEDRTDAAEQFFAKVLGN